MKPERIGIVITVATLLYGGGFWISSMYAQTVQNAQESHALKNEMSRLNQQQNNFQLEVIQRLARIEEKLNRGGK